MSATADMLDRLSGRGLLASFPEPALVIDAEGHILGGSDAANELLATTTIPQGESILRFLPEGERRRLNPLQWLRHWAEAPHAPELQHVRLYCRDAQGRETPVRVRAGRLAGMPGCYLVVLQDVAVEQARIQETRNAHRLAARLLAISADGILNVDERLRITYANASAEAMFGYPPGALTDQPLSMLLPERYRHDHERFMRGFAEAPEPSRLMGQRGEIRGLTRDGEEIPLEASITKVSLDHELIMSAILRRPGAGERAIGSGDR